MMNNDYIMRIIEHFFKALASIIHSRKAENYEEASNQIKMASRYYLKTDLALLEFSRPEQLLEHFKSYTNDIDYERCILCADLLHELALLKTTPEEAKRLKISSLYLYITALPKQPQFQNEDYFRKTSSLIEELQIHLHGHDIQEKLKSYRKFLTGN